MRSAASASEANGIAFAGLTMTYFLAPALPCWGTTPSPEKQLGDYFALFSVSSAHRPERNREIRKTRLRNIAS